jgi:hypothetical protein
MKASSELFLLGYPALASPAPARWPRWGLSSEMCRLYRRKNLQRRAEFDPKPGTYRYAGPWAQATLRSRFCLPATLELGRRPGSA